MNKEVDDQKCHPECNVESCCYQHGTCAALLYEDYIDAKLLSFDDATVNDATTQFQAICDDTAAGRGRRGAGPQQGPPPPPPPPVAAVGTTVATGVAPVSPASRGAMTDDSQLQLTRASCQMAASLNAGLDMLGRDQKFADSLEWKRYEEVIGTHMDALEAVESVMAEANAARKQEATRDVLLGKMALMQMEISSDITEKIEASAPHTPWLDSCLIRAPYVLYVVKYTDVAPLAPFPGDGCQAVGIARVLDNTGRRDGG